MITKQTRIKQRILKQKEKKSGWVQDLKTKQNKTERMNSPLKSAAVDHTASQSDKLERWDESLLPESLQRSAAFFPVPLESSVF